ncbi:uncharacterized protein TNIN_473811 [Trichonephila inaurata madagascariensis]|uniref:Uncharacterized protein n=1 Tax=Trichonephila inaurata madagascariensis TaxID=2747483 RepID=A0A8X6XPG7_9ARAC|nr:uncharacterized protein TNIN_473811 [Trichonephila inaurata madagascariensis]
MEPIDNWKYIPSIAPTVIGNRHPYLYFSAIVIAGLIVGTAFLVILRSCYRLFIMYNYVPFHNPNDVPVITGFRRSLLPTDTIRINRRLLPDDIPPSYASIVPNSGVHQTETYVNKFMKSSETPPPSYNSIVNI